MIRSLLRMLFTSFFLLPTSGCDETFSPLTDSDLPFSMFGLLNASADTQWIRVMPVRPFVQSPQASIDAIVTLTHVASGKETLLRDSLFRFASPDPDRVEDLYAHVFWTTEPIVEGEGYRLRATRSDGAFSEVDVPVPPRITQFSVDVRLSTLQTIVTDRAHIDGPRHLALLDVMHHRVIRVFQHPREATFTAPATHSLTVSRLLVPIDEDPEVCAKGRLCDIRVIASGIPWPFQSNLQEHEVLYAELGNIRGGSGFVGGISVTVFPYESCSREGLTGRDDICRLTYNSETAWLAGVIRDAGCSNEAIIGAKVTLRQMGGDRTRGTKSERNGEYRIGALEGGSVYAMRIEAASFEPYEELVSFTTSQTTKREVSMTRIGRCPSTPT